MCGRYSLITQRDDLAHALDLDPEIIPDTLETRYNIAPTDPVPALVNREGMRMGFLRWGLIPWWAKDPAIGNRMINARRETLTERSAFRDAFRERRCLLIADGFYEWFARNPGEPRVPHYIRMKDGRPFTFAGLWDRWRPPEGEPVFSCTIVTGEPNETVASIHDRMPVIIPKANRDAWLDPDQQDATTLSSLLRTYDDESLELYPVSRYVNKPGNEGEECIEPAEEPPPA